MNGELIIRPDKFSKVFKGRGVRDQERSILSLLSGTFLPQDIPERSATRTPLAAAQRADASGPVGAGGKVLPLAAPAVEDGAAGT
eukprot:CAMPEP_0178576566 /NCGR_PEP_ID=MMETSP0697-20121206/20527_1 /TAXON_ID=265572 /ORGANISM="Extubocellulus spinifer, Strain CCMP396" /LENGTH=84 /DNA_ID=CAMNT_0020211775 /DNA_START=917 /DNA_END=1171 /DNA_ORIENTATION=+